MIITYFRSSSFNTHDDCPQRYYLEYVLGWTGESGQAATKGTIVHKVLEILAMCKLAEQQGKNEIFDDEVLKKRKLSQLKDVKKITEEVYKYYSDNNSHIDWKPADKKDCHEWVHTALTMNDCTFDPRLREIVQPERSFDLEIPHDWANYSYELNGEKIEGKLHIKGTIDLVTKLDDNLYEIVDWKTGKKYDWAKCTEKTNATLQKDPQLMLYHYAASLLYPQVEDILVTINFIRFGGPTTVVFTKKDLAKTEDMLRRKFDAIKATRIPKLNKTWKCTKLCHQGKTTFEGTNIQPQITSLGGTQTKCEQTHTMIKEKGIDWVTENYMKSGHNPGYYQAPGAI